MHKNMNACFNFMLISCAEAVSLNQKLNGQICNIIDYKLNKKIILKKRFVRVSESMTGECRCTDVHINGYMDKCQESASLGVNGAEASLDAGQSKG